MDTLNIYSKKKKIFFFLLITIVFVAIGGLITIGSLVEKDTPILLFGIFLTGMFGIIMFYFLKTLKSPHPVLTISLEGIMDRTTLISPGLIRWQEIKSISYTKMSGQLYLSIYTKDPNFVIDQMSGIKKLLNRMNKSMLSAQVNIPVKNLAYKTEQLHEDIHMTWKLAISQNTQKTQTINE